MLDNSDAVEILLESLDAVEVQKAFLYSMKSAYCIHDLDFSNPHTMDELQDSENLAWGAGLLLWDSLYKIRYYGDF